MYLIKIRIKQYLYNHKKLFYYNIFNIKFVNSKLLETLTLKRPIRTKYPESNVVYIVSTKDNMNKRIYIVGKAINLTERLTQYNKTCEHIVIYYKGFKNEKYMEIAENIVLTKLDCFREQANRDRFILPIGEDITFFTNEIDKCIEFFN